MDSIETSRNSGERITGPQEQEPSNLAKLIAVQRYFMDNPGVLGMTKKKDIVEYLCALTGAVNSDYQGIDPVGCASLQTQLENLYSIIPEDQRRSVVAISSGHLAVNLIDPKLGDITDEDKEFLLDDPRRVRCPVSYKDVL